jgi:hypothetical protein
MAVTAALATAHARIAYPSAMRRLHVIALAIGAACVALLIWSAFGDRHDDVHMIAPRPASRADSAPARPVHTSRHAKETKAPDAPERSEAGPPTRSQDVEQFPVGEDWIAHLRDIKKRGGIQALVPALDGWAKQLRGVDGEPTRASVLLGKTFVEKALGRDHDAEQDLVEAVAAMVPEPGALRVRWEGDTTWPMMWNLLPVPRTSAIHGTLRGACGVHGTWCQDLRVYPWSPEDTFEPWLVALSQDDAHPETAMAAATLRHLLIYTEDLPWPTPAAWPPAALAAVGRRQSDAAAASWKEGAVLCASLRAQVLDRFADVSGERVDKIRVLVRTILEPPPPKEH